MKIDPRTIASSIDHTLLAPGASLADFEQTCRFAAEHGCASVCVSPFFVRRASELLRGSGVAVCTVIGFPHGANSTAAKVTEARIALEEGADELDMVVNLTWVKEGEWESVSREIEALARTAHSAGRILKVIFECSALTDEQKVALCKICTQVGADFVKTSTGFGSGGATVHDVALMKANVGAGVRIKAAGGIRDLDTLLALREAGATRFGCSRTEAVLAEAAERL